MTLVINYMEIENFKSYFGKNILGPFHQVNTFWFIIVCLNEILFNLINNRVLMLSLGRMGQENRMLSTHYYLYLALKLKRFAPKR
jgi:hypothetical protein